MNDNHEQSAPMFVYDGSFAPPIADLTAATLSEKNLYQGFKEKSGRALETHHLIFAVS
jgi:hypothetical protein